MSKKMIDKKWLLVPALFIGLLMLLVWSLYSGLYLCRTASGQANANKSENLVFCDKGK